jgi:hypothetical protein
MTNNPSVYILLRRFLWVAAFAFWMGGFSFYGGVVITVGARVVAGGEGEFGFVTRQVTHWLNLIGGVALGVFLVSMLLDWTVLPRLGRWAVATVWVGLALLHAGLIAIHPAMDALLDPATLNIHDRSRFHRLHKAYILLSSLQWAGCLVFLAATLYCWSRRDADQID